MEASALKYQAGIGLNARTPLLRLQSDERLISILRRGNPAAFEVLVSRYETRLLAFCRHLLGSREDAEDVLQEVMTAAFHAIVADERPINVRPWLYRIARNRSLNHMRRTHAIGVDSMDHHLSEHGTTTADKVHKREEFRLLVGDIQHLPETQRTALVLREMDALSYDQIAEAMETTVSSVKSLLVRARMSLAEASEARLLTCEEVRIELAEIAEGLAKRPSPLVRRHLKGCKRCASFKTQLKSTNKALAALLPVGPYVVLRKLAFFHLGHSAGAGAGTTRDRDRRRLDGERRRGRRDRRLRRVRRLEHRLRRDGCGRHQGGGRAGGGRHCHRRRRRGRPSLRRAPPRPTRRLRAARDPLADRPGSVLLREALDRGRARHSRSPSPRGSREQGGHRAPGDGERADRDRAGAGAGAGGCGAGGCGAGCDCDDAGGWGAGGGGDDARADHDRARACADPDRPDDRADDDGRTPAPDCHADDARAAGDDLGADHDGHRGRVDDGWVDGGRFDGGRGHDDRDDCAGRDEHPDAGPGHDADADSDSDSDDARSGDTPADADDPHAGPARSDAAVHCGRDPACAHDHRRHADDAPDGDGELGPGPLVPATGWAHPPSRGLSAATRA